uniref:Fork-head domain-containing protein n=1 Tax=Loa loa TaxID=7209 RepID=A0A1I7VAV2_LOALO
MPYSSANIITKSRRTMQKSFYNNHNHNNNNNNNHHYHHYHHNHHYCSQRQQQQHHHYDNRQTKSQPSYIGLIAMAILSSREQKMVLSEVYQWIIDNYPYFRTRAVGWRNSIRHNLSLNDCFIKAGRSTNGKGHYWAIHPANLDDFKKGDFRRRRAQRKVRRHMGLMINEDECSDDSPISTPIPVKKSFTIESILRPEFPQQPLLPFMHAFLPLPLPLPYHLYSNYFYA